jgi:hypothetical protein
MKALSECKHIIFMDLLHHSALAGSHPRQDIMCELLSEYKLLSLESYVNPSAISRALFQIILSGTVPITP